MEVSDFPLLAELYRSVNSSLQIQDVLNTHIAFAASMKSLSVSSDPDTRQTVMEHTVNSLRATSGSYPRITSDVSQLCFESRVLESTLVDRQQSYTIEYQQSQAGQQGSLSYS